MASTGTKTTIKLATLTGAAKNDVFSYDEDSLGNGIVLNVLANDPGAAKLYSVWQPVSEPAGTTPATSNQLPVLESTTLPSGATITMNADGTIGYVPGSGYDYLPEGETATDAFSYTVRMANGALSTATVTVTITGTNDRPVASAATNSVNEDAIINGSVSATDADEGETATLEYALVNPDAAPTGLTFNGDGSYSFDASSYDYLTDGEKLELTILFTASDATSTSTSADLTITITGTNDVPVASAETNSVDEDTSIDGSVSATDADEGETATLEYALVNPDAAPTGLTFNGDGSYSFDASSYDYLTDGEKLELTIPFTASDATSTSEQADLKITITGTNDEASISGTATGTVTEDSSTQYVSGTLTVSDLDNGETGFKPVSDSELIGTYGSFTFDDSNGVWGYTLNNTADIVQKLTAADTKFDKLTVSSLDGTTQEISVTILGADDPIGGDTTDGGGTGNGDVEEFGPVNRGNSKPYEVTGFDGNDILKYSADKITYDDIELINGYGSDSIQDTQINFYWDTPRGEQDTGTAILIDFVGFNSASQLIAVNGS